MSMGTTSTLRTARIKHDCLMCGAVIEPGEAYQRTKGQWEGEWQDWAAHKVCHDIYPPGECSPDEGWCGIVDLAETAELLEAFLARFPPEDEDDAEYASQRFGVIGRRKAIPSREGDTTEGRANG